VVLVVVADVEEERVGPAVVGKGHGGAALAVDDDGNAFGAVEGGEVKRRGVL
jgi:hypothetical protein